MKNKPLQVNLVDGKITFKQFAKSLGCTSEDLNFFIAFFDPYWDYSSQFFKDSDVLSKEIVQYLLEDILGCYTTEVEVKNNSKHSNFDTFVKKYFKPNSANSFHKLEDEIPKVRQSQEYKVEPKVSIDSNIKGSTEINEVEKLKNKIKKLKKENKLLKKELNKFYKW